MKKIIKNILCSLVFLILTITIFYFVYFNKIQKTEVTNVSTELPYYIELNFKPNKKKLTFENIPLNDIKVISGEVNIDVEKRYFPNRFTMYIINLTGEYHLKYRGINFIVNNETIYINNKVIKGNGVVIDNKGNIEWASSVNYWEIPADSIQEYMKNGNSRFN